MAEAHRAALVKGLRHCARRSSESDSRLSLSPCWLQEGLGRAGVGAGLKLCASSPQQAPSEQPRRLAFRVSGGGTFRCTVAISPFRRIEPAAALALISSDTADLECFVSPGYPRCRKPHLGSRLPQPRPRALLVMAATVMLDHEAHMRRAIELSEKVGRGGVAPLGGREAVVAMVAAVRAGGAALGPPTLAAFLPPPP